MTKEDVELIDKLIDVKLTRFLFASIVAHNTDMDEKTTLAMMVPIEAAVEMTKLKLITS